ncbi:MAG: hypothetical protein OXG62_10595 [Nitrospinae bacterium]|nr:hypothetical protein [Nitrospinota bacterium]
MKHSLTLVKLTPEQIQRAKEVNGERKRITHALICGPHGQRFGTKKQCQKYFDAWNPLRGYDAKNDEYFKPIFPELFDKAVITEEFEVSDFKSTPNLVMKLIKAQDATRK